MNEAEKAIMSYRTLFGALASLCLAATWTQTASAQETASPVEIESLFACQSKADDDARLTCFDQAVGALRAANEAGDFVALSRDDVEVVERDAFGLNLPSLPRLRGMLGFMKSDAELTGGAVAGMEETRNPQKEAESLDRVMLQVDHWETFNRGRYRFYLTNGQIWTQTDSDTLRRPKKDEDGILNVEIRKASFGSFLLQLNGKGRSVRVRRVE